MDIYFTSDIHGYLSARDFHSPSRKGGYFEVAKHFKPGSIVIDGGDNLQGSPLAMYAMNKDLPFPQAAAFKAAGLNAFVPGNHDFNFGEEVLARYIRETGAIALGANISSTVLDIKPYVIINDIAFIGVVTDYINVWERPENLKNTRILDSVECAKKALEDVRKSKPKAVVCIYHGGYENSYSSTTLKDTIENRALELMDLGFDVLLTSHQHMRTAPFHKGKCMTLQNSSNGLSYAHLEICDNGIKAEVLNADEGECYDSFPLSEEEKRISYLNDEVDVYLSKVIGTTESIFEDRDKTESMFHGSSLADFFNQVQIEATGADISVASLFNEPRSLGPEVSIGDIISAYPFPNTLVVLEVSGAELKTALERSASFLSISDGKEEIAKDFLFPKVELYNYDYYLGLSYVFDVTKEVGNRVVSLNYKSIDLLEDKEKKLSLVMNNYRASGTGGYEVFTKCKVLKSYQDDFQEVLINYFKKNSFVTLKEKADFHTIS